MRNNETGEFELVVGNRQLLSAFFIIVLLFAVAFAMGYVVGENSRTSKTAEIPTSSTPAMKPVETRPEPVAAAANPPATAAEEKPAEAAAPPADAPAQPATQPAREEAPAPAPPAAAASAAAPQATGDPSPGSYWQIIATANHDSAATLVQTLRDKGFPATLTPGPNNLTRVLVGPYNDTGAMGRAKTELEGAGFNKLVTFKNPR
jgi:cell division septation protein DedD